MTQPRRFRAAAATAAGLGLLAGALAAGPVQAQFRQEITNDLNRCRAGKGPALLVSVHGIKAAKGAIRVQTYRATQEDWLVKRHWLHRIEVPARTGSMTFCLPVPAPGNYAVAVRHDINGNGETDITSDGGGMSNNPSINIFNLGKPSYRKTSVSVGADVKPIRIDMRYM